MAKFTISLVAIAMVSAIGGALASTTLAIEGVALPEGPTISNGDFPLEFYTSLQSCADKLTPTCGDEIFSGVLINGKVTDYCCHKLVAMGKTCHDDLVLWMLSVHAFRENAAQILSNTEKFWYQCTQAVSPSPSS